MVKDTTWIWAGAWTDQHVRSKCNYCNFEDHIRAFCPSITGRGFEFDDLVKTKVKKPDTRKRDRSVLVVTAPKKQTKTHQEAHATRRQDKDRALRFGSPNFTRDRSRDKLLQETSNPTNHTIHHDKATGGKTRERTTPTVPATPPDLSTFENMSYYPKLPIRSPSEPGSAVEQHRKWINDVQRFAQ